MKTINAATDLFEAIEVDLWGTKFSVVQPTRAVERKIIEALKAVEDIPDDADEETVFDALAGILDLQLDPIPGEDGKKTRAKTVVRNLYKDGKIGIAHLEALFEVIAAHRAERPS
jgi:hypothetical protein